MGNVLSLRLNSPAVAGKACLVCTQNLTDSVKRNAEQAMISHCTCGGLLAEVLGKKKHEEERSFWGS